MKNLSAAPTLLELLHRLRRNQRTGSKPRCHILTSGLPGEVAARLTALIAPYGTVSPNDRWMPQGFEDLEEAQLHNAPRIVNSDLGEQLGEWWLAVGASARRTPNFDIASTCIIDGKPGLMLVEAKAHLDELVEAAAGRVVQRKRKGRLLTEKELGDQQANRESIRHAISSACDGLRKNCSLEWRLSVDSHYQMSNRFAWSWKLTELRIPVVLVYLGFLNAGEMRAGGGHPFSSSSDWEESVRLHSKPLFPPESWEKRWMCNGQAFIPLIRSLEVALPE